MLTFDFEALPYDVAATVLKFLSVDDTVTFSQVSRYFYQLASERSVWYHQACNLLSRCRPLPLKGFTQPEDISDLELKRCVLKAHYLEQNWTSPQPKILHSRSMKMLGTERLDLVMRVWRISSGYMLLCTVDSCLVCWDLQRERLAGIYRMATGALVFNCRLDYRVGKVYCILGRYPDTDLPEYVVFSLQTGRFLTDGRDMHVPMEFSVLQVTFPTDSLDDSLAMSEQVDFQVLSTFRVPHFRVVDIYILDPIMRSVCVLYLAPGLDHVGMFVLFDWARELSINVNTGIHFDHRTVVATTLSEDQSEVVVLTETFEAETRFSYSMQDLRSLAVDNRSDKHAIQRRNYSVRKWANVSPASSADSYIHECSYFYRQWWPMFPGITTRLSTAILYKRLSTPGTAATICLGQHYSTGSGPCSPNRWVLNVEQLLGFAEDEVRLGEPLMEIDFSHAVWVQHTPEGRKAMMVTFPTPEDEAKGQTVLESLRTLDIPGGVLDNAHHLVLDQSQGSIIVVTYDKSLHIYSFC